MSDIFENRLSQKLVSHPSLAKQTQGRPLSDLETSFAEALMEIYASGEHDFDLVSSALTKRGTIAPVSKSNSWSKKLLESELKQINGELDKAYADNIRAS